MNHLYKRNKDSRFTDHEKTSFFWSESILNFYSTEFFFFQTGFMLSRINSVDRRKIVWREIMEWR